MLTVPLIAYLAVTTPAPQLRGIDLLKDVVSNLSSASSLQAEFIYGNVNDVQSRYKLTYQKPGVARIENESLLVIANTRDIVVYNKVRNTYSRQPQDAASFRELVTSPDVTVLGGFFYPDLFTGVVDPIYAGPAMRGPSRLESVKFKFNEENSAVLYIDPKEKLVRQAEMEIETLGNKRSFVFNASSVKLNQASPKEAFNFMPPPGAREVPPDSDVWYTDVKEARRAAWATNRLVLMYFASPTNSDCKYMEQSIFTMNVFKRTAREFVFLRIDATKNDVMVRGNSVSILPTIIFTRFNGSELDRVTGRTGMHSLIEHMQTAMRRAGK